ncbi:hypothetical protein RND81_11G106500 [Saponaria officinalis]|uniref:Protein E6-like n=1 Tax=Saponaria officinalis TaxID=3572 RepID=A0AAW1HLI0_SAPOF
MALSFARCFFFFLLIISFLIQIHAREAKFFSKVTKTTKEKVDSISISPILSPSPAPAPAESEVVEHGYGLYGRDPYENIPKNTVKDTEKLVFEEKYVPAEELSRDSNSDSLEKGYSKDGFERNEYQYTPTTENPTNTPIVGEEKYVHPTNEEFRNNNEYVSEKQGMSDTRFLENGRYYYYDIGQNNKEVVNNNNYNYVRNNEGNEGYVPQKQGMSDTKYLENGKYFYDLQNEEGVKEKSDVLFNDNNNENEQFQEERHGMSDTRYLNNGNYFYDVKNENENDNKAYNNGYVNDNQGYSSFEGNTNKYPNEYVSQGKKGNYGPKKFPNEYDTMEEYDREQGYVDPQDVYVP